MPEDWHKTKAMRWISNDIWPMDELPDKKRKRDAMNEKNDEEAMIGDEEAMMMHSVCLYMTPRSYERFRLHRATSCEGQNSNSL